MFAKLKKLFLVVCLASFPASIFANPQDDGAVFISLTRKPTVVEKLPTNITTVTSEDIAKTGAQTLTEVLDKIPGIKTEPSGMVGSFATVKMRGVPTSNHVQVLVDGQSLGGASVQNIDVGLIPIHNIDRIEVIRGGGSVLYGANTIGGIVHIFTKQQTEDGPSLSVDFEGRSHKTETYKAQAGAKGKRVDALVSGQKFRTDGYQQNSDADQESISGQIGVSFDNGARMSFQSSYIDRETGSPEGTSVPFDQWDGKKERASNSLTNRIEQDVRRNRLDIKVPVFNAVVQSLGHQSVDNYEYTAMFSAKFRNTIIGNDTQILFPNGFVLGGAYERDERISLAQDPHHITNWALFVQDEWSLNPFTIIPALRMDQHSLFGSEYNPRVSIVHQTNEKTRITASAARSIRAPTLTDLYEDFPSSWDPAYDFYGNPNLKPEVAWSYDLGTEITVLNIFRMNVSGYYTRIRDRIAAVDTGGPLDMFGMPASDTSINISHAELSGAEAVLDTQTGTMVHRLNYTFQRAIGNSPGSSTFLYLRLTPKHLLNYRLEFPLCSDHTLINEVEYVSRQFQLDGDRGFEIPGFTSWNIRLQQSIKAGTIFVGIDNVTDKIYTRSVTSGNGTPMPGRTFRTGLSMKFPVQDRQ